MVPFNFPFWLAFKSMIPKLAMGNTVLMKGADSCPRISLKIEELFIEAGYTNHQVQSVFVEPRQLEVVLSNDKICGVGFTGSTQVGRIVAGMAGK